MTSLTNIFQYLSQSVDIENITRDLRKNDKITDKKFYIEISINQQL